MLFCNIYLFVTVLYSSFTFPKMRMLYFRSIKGHTIGAFVFAVKFLTAETEAKIFLEYISL